MKKTLIAIVACLLAFGGTAVAQKNAQEQLQNREAELLKPIIDRAKKAIEDVAKEGGYTYILDAGTAAILYSQDSDDIMPLVKKKLGLK